MTAILFIYFIAQGAKVSTFSSIFAGKNALIIANVNAPAVLTLSTSLNFT